MAAEVAHFEDLTLRCAQDDAKEDADALDMEQGGNEGEEKDSASTTASAGASKKKKKKKKASGSVTQQPDTAGRLVYLIPRWGSMVKPIRVFSARDTSC